MRKKYLPILAAGLLVVGGAAVTQAEVVIIPYVSGLPSPDSDLVVTFDASRAACYDKSFPQPTCTNPLPDTSDPDPANHIAGGCSDTGAACWDDGDCYDPNIKQTITPLSCTFSWDFGDGGAGSVIGGNGTDVIVYEYFSPGNFDVTLTMTDPVSTVAESSTITVTAAEVGPPGKSVTFSTTVTDATCVDNACVGGGNNGLSCTGNADCPGGEVLLTFDTAPSDLKRAYIYWGDRRRTILVDPVASDAAGHTYDRERTYNIRVMTIDINHERLDYTSTDDPSLTVAP